MSIEYSWKGKEKLRDAIKRELLIDFDPEIYFEHGKVVWFRFGKSSYTCKTVREGRNLKKHSIRKEV